MAKVIQELLVGFGLDVDKQSFDSASAGITEVTGALGSLAAVAAGGIGLKDLTLDFASAKDELGKFSEFMDIAPNKVQALERALMHFGGTAGDARSLISSVTAAMDDFKAGSKLSEAGMDLGFDTTMIAQAGSAEEAIRRIADAFQSVEKSKARAFGSALGFNQAQIKFLRGGSGGIDQAFAESQKLGEVTAEMTKNAANFNDSLQNMTQAIGNVKDQISNDILPGLTNFMGKVTGFVTENPEEAKAIGSTAMGIASGAAAGAAAGRFFGFPGMALGATIGGLVGSSDGDLEALVGAKSPDWMNLPTRSYDSEEGRRLLSNSSGDNVTINAPITINGGEASASEIGEKVGAALNGMAKNRRSYVTPPSYMTGQ